MDIGGLKDRVKAMREELGLTQEQLAAEGRLRRDQICHIERGDNQASSNAVRAGLARAFGLSRDDTDEYLEGRITLKIALRRRGRTGTDG